MAGLALLAIPAAACAPRTPSPDRGAEPDTAAGVAVADSAALAERPEGADSLGVADSLGIADSAGVADPRAAGPGPTVCAGGDLLIGTNLDTTWAARWSEWMEEPVDPLPDPDSVLAPLKPLVEGADLVLVNLEGAIGAGTPEVTKCRPGSRTCYAFRQPPAVAGALVRFAGPAAMAANLANNHAGDVGLPGLDETRAHLAEAGAHMTGSDTLPTVVITGRGDTIALLGFATARAAPDARDLEAVRRHVARAAERHAHVIVTAHLGGEGGEEATRTRDTTEIYLGEDRGNPVAFARTVTEAGAAVVFGHGPHVLRAAEWWGDALVFYSLGNLLTYGPFNLLPPRDIGAIACAELDRAGGVAAAWLRPTRQRAPGVAFPDSTGRAAVLVDSLGRLDFPETGAHVRLDGSLLHPPGAGRR